jgi:mono/diheme cytochrome c family protein
VRSPRTGRGAGATGLAVVAALGWTLTVAEAGGDVDRGRYVFGATGGCGCHTILGQPANSGGRRYDGPFGTVYASNITPDPRTGIGSWTDEQIVRATRLGIRPNGERLIPVHPYTAFNGMTDADLNALVAFLRTVPPVNRATPPKKITVPLFESVFLPAWLVAFAPRETPPASVPETEAARGEYLVRVVAHCGECHTPRTLTMATDARRFLAGTAKGPENYEVSNITPDPATGLTWSVEEIAEYLATGTKPSGEVSSGLMIEVIQGTLAGYRNLSRADRLAIARYLKTVPPVANKIGK